MNLYGYYRSSTSYRVRIALNLKGLVYQNTSINLRESGQFDESFTAINPHQSLPVLEVDDNRLLQSAAILDWLEETHPSPPFLPSDPRQRQICREFYYAIATEIHAPNNLSVLNYLKGQFNAREDDIIAWNQVWILRSLKPIEQRLAMLEWQDDALPFGHATLFEIALIPQLYNARRWQTDLSGLPTILNLEQTCLKMAAFDHARPEGQPDHPEEIV